MFLIFRSLDFFPIFRLNSCGWHAFFKMEYWMQLGLALHWLHLQQYTTMINLVIRALFFFSFLSTTLRKNWPGEHNCFVQTKLFFFLQSASFQVTQSSRQCWLPPWLLGDPFAHAVNSWSLKRLQLDHFQTPSCSLSEPPSQIGKWEECLRFFSATR